MSLKPGTCLGPYEIVTLLGAGGMGEVYKARDTRLGREVAFKSLAGDVTGDAAFRARFEHEARAVASLNHPNIVAIYDVGDGYIVSEYVDGSTLRVTGQLSVRRVLDIASQIADGLAAAHAIGIVHRDIKPENIMLTRDGRAKILDFGLAKRSATAAPDPTRMMTEFATQPGFVIGTANYMSPEQIRGQPVDHRSDIFSLGLVIYEMLTGQRAFSGPSAPEVMSSILREDPPPLPPPVPPALSILVTHCLEKDPDRRLQSARDLSVSLRALSADSHPAPVIEQPPPKARKSGMPWWTGLLAVVTAAAAGVFVGKSLSVPELPSFKQVTFQRGFVSSGRFAAGGKRVVYSARWNADGMDVFAAQRTSPESRALGFRGSHLFSISNNDQLAIGMDARFTGDNSQAGTLAVVPLDGGAPRPMLADVHEADWDPAGKQLAVVRSVAGIQRIEYPIGKVLYQTAGWIGDLRFSPAGDRIAFTDHTQLDDDRGSLALVDLSGQVKQLSKAWESIEGVLWSPDGQEVWYAASDSGYSNTIYATGLSGKQRIVARFATGVKVHDRDADGHILFSVFNDHRSEVWASTGAGTPDRPVDWLGSSFPADLSADGKLLLFSQYGEAGGTNYTVYARRLEGSAPERLGEGEASCLSPDAKLALVILNEAPPQLLIQPTGIGSARRLPPSKIVYQQSAQWLPDSQHILIAGNEPGRGSRIWLQDVSSGDPKPVSPEGVMLDGDALSPDSTVIAARSPEGVMQLYPLSGEPPRPLPGITPADRVIRWRPDGKRLLVMTSGQLPAELVDVNATTGERVKWRELSPSDSTGVTELTQVLVSADGNTIVYGQNRKIRTLQIAAGLR